MILQSDHVQPERPDTRDKDERQVGDDHHQGAGVELRELPHPRPATARSNQAEHPGNDTQIRGRNQVPYEQLWSVTQYVFPARHLHRRDGEAQRDPDSQAAEEPSSAGPNSPGLIPLVDDSWSFG